MMMRGNAAVYNHECWRRKGAEGGVDGDAVWEGCRFILGNKIAHSLLLLIIAVTDWKCTSQVKQLKQFVPSPKDSFVHYTNQHTFNIIPKINQQQLLPSSLPLVSPPLCQSLSSSPTPTSHFTPTSNTLPLSIHFLFLRMLNSYIPHLTNTIIIVTCLYYDEYDYYEYGD